MKPIMLVAFAPLALAACNPANPFGGKSATGNTTTAAVPVTPDAVIVNGVTYVRAGGGDTIAPSVPSTSPTAPVASTVPTVTPTIAPSPVAPVDTSPPPSSANPDGVTVTGGH
jgi:hypothetical protein